MIDRVLDIFCEKKSIFLLFIASSVVCITYEITDNIPELFYGGGVIFKFFTQVSYSIIASCIFYFLTVYVKELQIRKRLEVPIYVRLGIISDEMRQLYNAFFGDVPSITKKINFTDNEIKCQAKLVRLNEVIHSKRPNGSLYTFKEFLMNKINKINKEVDEINKYYISYLTLDEIDILHKIAKSQLCETAVFCFQSNIADTQTAEFFDEELVDFLKLYHKLGDIMDKISLEDS